MTQFKARPTMYKGIQMRSRLEAGFAAWLDKFGIAWEYEPRAYASESGQYLPDFLLPQFEFVGLSTDVFVEVKPTQPDIELLLSQRAIVLDSEPEAQLVAIWPDGGHYRTLLAYDGYSIDLIWSARPHGLSLEAEVLQGPWHGEYWKPRPS